MIKSCIPRIGRERPDNRRFHLSLPFEVDGTRYMGGAGFGHDGRLLELFLRSATKPDSAVDTTANDAAIMASLLLQQGMSAQALRHSLGRGPIAKLLDLLGEGMSK